MYYVLLPFWIKMIASNKIWLNIYLSVIFSLFVHHIYQQIVHLSLVYQICWGQLFQRCLIKVLNIDLWKLYLSYIKETKGTLTSYREKMAQAYDFALEKIGMDIMSYQIWVDYINFLKSV